MNLKDFYTMEQARQVLCYQAGQSVKNRAELQAVKWGRAWYFSRTAVDALADTLLSGELLELSLVARRHAVAEDLDTEQWQPLSEVLTWYPYSRQLLYQRVNQEREEGKIRQMECGGQMCFSVADIKESLEAKPGRPKRLTKQETGVE